MPTSTLIGYGLGGINYAWDSITGILFTSGMVEFFVLLVIITAVIFIARKGIFSIFGMK